MSTPPSFGHTLKHYRKACDLTQEQLAEQVSCSVETIKKIEAGKLRPGRQLAELLAVHLAVAPTERESFLRGARASLPTGQPLAPTTQLTERLAPPASLVRCASASTAALPQGTLTFLFTDIQDTAGLPRTGASLLSDY